MGFGKLVKGVKDAVEFAVEDAFDNTPSVSCPAEGEGWFRGSFDHAGVAIDVDLQIKAEIEIKDDGWPYLKWATYTFWFGIGSERVIISRTQRREFSDADLDALWRHVLANSSSEFQDALCAMIEAVEIGDALPSAGPASGPRRL